MNRILRLKEVIHITGLSKSDVYRLVQLGRFPKPFKIAGLRISGWNAAAVERWTEAELAQPDPVSDPVAIQ